jgi:hypothetical protein
MRFFYLLGTALWASNVADDKDEYFFNVVTEGEWSHIIRGGCQASRKSFPFADYLRCVFLDEYG